jgi:hypothetical protein
MTNPSAQQRSIISAIHQLGRRVTAGDIAAKTGIGILEANRQLNAIASDCAATLQVTADGNLVYVFAPLFEGAYLKKGFAKILRRVGAGIFNVGFFLLRISFGITLIASLVTVVTLIVVAVIGMVQRSNNSNSGVSGGGGSSFDWVADLGNFFCFNVTYRTASAIGASLASPGFSSVEDDYAAYTQGRYIPAGATDTKSPGFILNCFTYLFGDGNPNPRLEEKKWKLIAEHIRSSHGVTTCDQLACYTAANPRKEEECLPVLVRFDGQPVVSERGNIFYQFPSLQSTAFDTFGQEVPGYLEEKRWSFAQQEGEEFVPVAVFALLNFAGCMWLLRHASTLPDLQQFRMLIDWLSVYAVFFLFFPLLRYVFLLVLNVGIDWRNARRLDNWKKLQQCTAKLRDAQAYSLAPNIAASDQVIYSTDKDLLDQQFD